MRLPAQLNALVALSLISGSVAVHAASPADLLNRYSSEARSQTPAFLASAQRGAEMYARRFGSSERMPSCASCHTEMPSLAGRHVVTDKPIKPLAPAANAERFSDAAKVEKWFGRNCREVIGRECSAGEKADFVAFMLEGR